MCPSAAPTPIDAADRAATAVAAVRDDPAGRLRLLRDIYEHGPHGNRLPYQRAAAAFMRWQCSRGVLEPITEAGGGSRWWRAVNESLLRDTEHARLLAGGAPGEPDSRAVSAWLDFQRRPSARSWYRAHNVSVVTGYLRHRNLAAAETRTERFFINVVLLRVLYAHALVAAPRLALGWLGPVAPPLGDPRLGMPAIFLSLRRVLPEHYPIEGEVGPYRRSEHWFGRLVDMGVIEPRLGRLYRWSATELGIPEVETLLVDGVPAYCWNPADRDDWMMPLTPPQRWVRRLVPPRVDQ